MNRYLGQGQFSLVPHPGRLFTPGVVILLVGIVGGWALSVLAGPGVTDLLALRASDLLHGRPWQVLTYWLVDGSATSVVLNSMAVLLVGSAVERQWKTRSLLTCWLVTSTVTGLIWTLVVLICGRNYQGMGAAAGVFGLLAALGLLHRGKRLLFPPMDAAVAAWMLIGIGVVLSLSNPISLIWVLGAAVAYIYIRIVWSIQRISIPGRGHSDHRPGRFVDLD
ncbi:MAG: rhomboid family intramembrane serine protease [Sedimentisphaerales bacterium]|nr:rhomboid family intramembrane serine protease [Sedimentisphaerales bacterium]